MELVAEKDDMHMLDIDKVLDKAPLKEELNPHFKNCVRLDIWRATKKQLQAELIRLDQVLHNQRSSKNKAESAYKSKRRQQDPEFRQHEIEYKRSYRLKAKA